MPIHSNKLTLKLQLLKSIYKEDIALMHIRKEHKYAIKTFFLPKANKLASKKDINGENNDIKAKFCILILYFF